MTNNQQNNDDEGKKPWVTPQLSEYGSVQTLTQSGATISANDGGTHRARRP